MDLNFTNHLKSLLGKLINASKFRAAVGDLHDRKSGAAEIDHLLGSFVEDGTRQDAGSWGEVPPELTLLVAFLDLEVFQILKHVVYDIIYLISK